MPAGGPFGITHRFQRLFRSEGYVGYVLLTLSPLYSSEDFLARLACLIHTASVRSEPGSNPSVDLIFGLFWSLIVPPDPKVGRSEQTRSHSNSRVTLFSKIASPQPPRRGARAADRLVVPRGVVPWAPIASPRGREPMRERSDFRLEMRANPAGFHRSPWVVALPDETIEAAQCRCSWRTRAPCGASEVARGRVRRSLGRRASGCAVLAACAGRRVEVGNHMDGRSPVNGLARK